jgi:hypothetical protein
LNETSPTEAGLGSQTEFEKLLQPGKLVFTILIPSISYPNQMGKLFRFAAETWKLVCLISINKPSSTIFETLKHAGIKRDSFLIVDAISIGAGLGKRERNVTYVSSPKAITELGIKVGNLLKQRKPRVLIFDSVAGLLIHVRESEVLEFMHMLISRARGTGIPVILPVFREDLDTPAIKNLNMFADAVVDLGER